MKILGIETSCDETAAAVVEDGRTVLSNAVRTQIPLHALYGGGQHLCGAADSRKIYASAVAQCVKGPGAHAAFANDGPHLIASDDLGHIGLLACGCGGACGSHPPFAGGTVPDHDWAAVI